MDRICLLDGAYVHKSTQSPICQRSRQGGYHWWGLTFGGFEQVLSYNVIGAQMVLVMKVTVLTDEILDPETKKP